MKYALVQSSCQTQGHGQAQICEGLVVPASFTSYCRACWSSNSIQEWHGRARLLDDNGAWLIEQVRHRSMHCTAVESVMASISSENEAPK